MPYYVFREDGKITGFSNSEFSTMSPFAEEVSEEEFLQLGGTISSTPSDYQKEAIKTLESENTLLKTQLQATSDRSDFIEDCIAEMAAEVYV